MKTSYLLFIILIPIISFSQFKIQGKIIDPENKENLEINLSIRGEIEKTIPVKINDASFFLEYTIDEPINSMLQIQNAGKSKSVKILVDRNSSYNVDLVLEDEQKYFDDKWFKIETKSSYYQVWRNFYDEQNELYLKKRNTLSLFEVGKISKKELDRQIDAIEFNITQAFKKLATEHPDNYATPYIITGAPDFGEHYFPYFKALSQNVRTSYWGRTLKSRLEDSKTNLSNNTANSSTILGSRFAVLKGNTLSGNYQEYSSANLNSKLTLIDFWASWCGPCRKENTALSVLNKNYAKSEFQIISFSLDTNQNKWEKASKIDNITWKNISDLKGVKSYIINDFQIKQLPRNILVNAEGKIIALDKTGTNLKDFVSEYLNSNP
ncbi:TlpA family protein disulfide reductase [Leeuwenhoekiella polynyae]|uniref:Thiol-disulfide isomerase/thioredoxin n=1 Tax=Leeuwenhoekiella polynyae TaxID=1550906 RepID=A0A4Q0NQQ8_9FLAO|nr:TlpA disulfide reductase family protein [Leeuwenhoekiella polynyae]RXG12831.1 thiol-disulfide isomerase/thioredoxin [Leeuwenhoekiella polynyae]